MGCFFLLFSTAGSDEQCDSQQTEHNPVSPEIHDLSKLHDVPAKNIFCRRF
jgi:hypothetical protein